MRIAVIGHHSRKSSAESLARRYGADLYMDNGRQGAYWNHLRALQDSSGPVLVMEDDAVPCNGFLDRASAAQKRWPGDLLSFYLGTGRPRQWQSQVAQAIKRADEQGNDWIALPKLLHGVCYLLPDPGIVVKHIAHGPVDFAIGDAWRKATGRDVIYTLPSLVDHEDGPSVQNGRRRDVARKAWRVA